MTFFKVSMAQPDCQNIKSQPPNTSYLFFSPFFSFFCFVLMLRASSVYINLKILWKKDMVEVCSITYFIVEYVERKNNFNTLKFIPSTTIGDWVIDVQCVMLCLESFRHVNVPSIHHSSPYSGSSTSQHMKLIHEAQVDQKLIRQMGWKALYCHYCGVKCNQLTYHYVCKLLS